MDGDLMVVILNFITAIGVLCYSEDSEKSMSDLLNEVKRVTFVIHVRAFGLSQCCLRPAKARLLIFPAGTQ